MAASHTRLAVPYVLARWVLIWGRWTARASDARLEHFEGRPIKRNVALWSLCLALLDIGTVRFSVSLTPLGPCLLGTLCCNAMGCLGLSYRVCRMASHAGPVLCVLLLAVISVYQSLETLRLTGALASFCPLEQALEAGKHVGVQACR